ncbi:MAG: hypothetical protein WBM71_07725 [Sedimenticolaceae bacterium]
MKTEKIGFSRSVAIIGLIYAVALAAAPETVLSAQPDPTRKAISVCPHAFGGEMSFAEFMDAYHRLQNRPSETPGLSSPAWGKAKVTIF